MFSEYVELREILEESFALPVGDWYQRIFGDRVDEPVMMTDVWKKLVVAYKRARDKAERLKIMQRLNDLMKKENPYHAHF